MKNTTPAILLLLACTAILASCGSDTAGTAPQDSGQTINLDEIEGLAVPRDEGTGWRVRWPRSGSGARDGMWARSGSGARTGSWNSFMMQMAPADQEIFKRMNEARRNGDTALADELQTELSKKYPNLPTWPGRGRGRFGSGSTGTGAIQ